MRDHIDCLGLLCPLPVLRARKRLLALASGDALELWADDPAAVVDVPHFCTEQGYDLVEQRDAEAETGPYQIYVIRKP